MPRDMVAVLEFARSLVSDISPTPDDDAGPFVANVAYVATGDGDETTLGNPLVAYVAEPSAAVATSEVAVAATRLRDKSDLSDQRHGWRQLWRATDPNRRCWTCGARPDHRYPDGSPAYTCHLTSKVLHEPIVERGELAS